MSQLINQLETFSTSLRNSRVATVALVITLSALPVVAIGVSAYYSAEHALTHQISNDNLEQSLAIRLAVDGYMNERAHDVMALAATALLADAQASTNAKSAAL